MSNKRAEGKKILSSWVFETDIKKLKQFAADNDVHMGDLIKALIKGLDTMDKKALNKLVSEARNLKEQ